MINNFTNKILYVPFSKEYIVNAEIKGILNENEFFQHCYVHPNFDKKIDFINKIDSETFQQDEYLYLKSELLENWLNHKNEKERFESWILNNEEAIYCITGDAGTGKSTYLHYLKYKYKEINWCIVDFQRTVDVLEQMGKHYEWKKFDKFKQKNKSVICLCIFDLIYVLNKNNMINFINTSKNIKKIINTYNKSVKLYYPEEIVAKLFEKIEKINYNGLPEQANDYCLDITETIFEWIDEVEKKTGDFIKLIKCYLILLYCKNLKKKNIIVFDNIERFIKTDEIFNIELVQFVDALRTFENNMKERFSKPNNIDTFASHFQFMVMMRNTSIRMLIPQQVSDFPGHCIDISDWFAVDEIIQKKIDWYNCHGIKLENSEWVLHVLTDVVCCNDSLRGIRLKIDRLFNYNKRLIVVFLNQIFNEPQNIKLINLANEYFNVNEKLKKSLSKFAYRSILMRLILNHLKKEDELIKSICSSDCANRNYYYCEKVLTILYNFSVENEKNKYFSFDSLIKELYGDSDNPIARYFDENSKEERKKLSEILYNMNYYDKRKNNWLQFIDIQYNVEDEKFVRVNSYEKWMEIIDNHRDDLDKIKLKITSSGEAFLKYIAFTYDFFAVKYNCNNNMHTIENLNKINLMKTDNSDKNILIKNMEFILRKIKDYISEYEYKNKRRIFLIKNKGNSVISSMDRIYNLHTGYLTNIIECLEKLYADSDEFKVQVNELVVGINNIKEEYSFLIENKK